MKLSALDFGRKIAAARRPKSKHEPEVIELISGTRTQAERDARDRHRPLRASYGADPGSARRHLGVDEGGIAAMLGANGAGKTTTLATISGLVRATGENRFAGARIDSRATGGSLLGFAHVPRGPRHLQGFDR